MFFGELSVIRGKRPYHLTQNYKSLNEENEKNLYKNTLFTPTLNDISFTINVVPYKLIFTEKQCNINYIRCNPFQNVNCVF